MARIAIINDVFPLPEFHKLSRRLFELKYYRADYGGIGPNWEQWLPNDIFLKFQTRELRTAIARRLSRSPTYVGACVPRLWNVTMRGKGDALDDLMSFADNRQPVSATAVLVWSYMAKSCWCSCSTVRG